VPTVVGAPSRPCERRTGRLQFWGPAFPGERAHSRLLQCKPPNYRPLQRRYELLIPKPLVGGSSPPGAADENKHLAGR